MASTSITDAQTQTGSPPLVPLTVISDVESSRALTRIDASWVSDIEHVRVNDDPRAWSRKLKVSRFVRLHKYTNAPWSRHVLVLIIPSADDNSDFSLYPFCLGPGMQY
jgi:hypothetical protein